MPATELRTLRFGHSPDADDAYMFYGFHTGEAAIDGCRVEHVLEDIQSLNRRALESADLEITAVSAHAYAFLGDRYAVLSCGASMGMGYGPVILGHGDAYFLLRRTRKQNEARLHDKLSLGIGGHINPGLDLLGGLQQELNEEVQIDDPYTLDFAGILNDESTEVGRVHLGAVYLLHASTDRVHVLEATTT